MIKASPKSFERKPQSIEAMQFMVGPNGILDDHILLWARELGYNTEWGAKIKETIDPPNATLDLTLLLTRPEGRKLILTEGCWLIRGIETGDVWSMSDELFKKLYA